MCLFTVYILPDREALIWPHDDGSKFIYAKIDVPEQMTYIPTEQSSVTVKQVGAGISTCATVVSTVHSAQ